MAQDQRIVGKYTLESLTTGMYADNRIIFREYVQNSADAIDKAVAEGILSSREEARIDITIDSARRDIRIRDNGIGIPAQEVYHDLGDIGNSQKSYREDRGFRGIGRLGGLGYCKELRFITSCKGETCKTITLWDCIELKRLLQPNVGKRMSLMDVVDAVTLQNEKPEKADEHYFEVVLMGVEEGHDNLVDFENIKDYLAQVVPVPFDYTNLTILDKINAKLKELGKEPEEFNIYLNHEPIYKPYKRTVSISEKQKDTIKDIEFFESYHNDGSLSFLGWYSIRGNLSFMIKEDNINGLRVRKKNILIGDNRTLDTFFGRNTDQRFNRYFAGEIYVFDDDLLPNARRDDFEKNAAYFRFKREVEKTTKEKLSRLPRGAQQARSNEKILHTGFKKIEEFKGEIQKGVTKTRRGQILKEVGEFKKRAKRVNPNVYTKIQPDPVSASPAPIETHKEPAFKVREVAEQKNHFLDQLDQLERDVKTTRKRLTTELAAHISADCRNVVEKIFDVIDRTLTEGLAKELKEQIIKELKH